MKILSYGVSLSVAKWISKAPFPAPVNSPQLALVYVYSIIFLKPAKFLENPK